jgi:hypothetical protein
MSRNNWIKNEVKKKPPTLVEVFRALDDSVWSQKHDKNDKIKIKHILLDRFLMESSYVSEIEEALELMNYISISELVLKYDIAPEFEQKLYDAVYLMNKGGIAPTQEQIECVRSIAPKVDAAVKLYEESGIDEQINYDELEDDMITEEDERRESEQEVLDEIDKK